MALCAGGSELVPVLLSFCGAILALCGNGGLLVVEESEAASVTDVSSATAGAASAGAVDAVDRLGGVFVEPETAFVEPGPVRPDVFVEPLVVFAEPVVCFVEPEFALARPDPALARPAPDLPRLPALFDRRAPDVFPVRPAAASVVGLVLSSADASSRCAVVIREPQSSMTSTRAWSTRRWASAARTAR
jgi:hypothetical protein